MNADCYKNKMLELLNTASYYSSIPNSNQKDIFAKIKVPIDKKKK